MLLYMTRGAVVFRKIPVSFVSSIRSYSSGEATFEVEPFKLYLLEEGPSTTVSVNKEDALRFYTQMSTIRRIENTCATLAHAWTWIMGESAFSLIAELAGKKGGCSRGKGGSMHTYATNFYGGNGIVGAHVCLYGDGAANQGQVYEAYNIAKLWKLPVVYVCENNKYAMGTATSRASAATDFYQRVPYMPGIWVDGMDVLAVREGFRFAMQYVRDGNGPLIVEASTYRYFGHSMSDPGISYRSRDEVQEARQTRDPITKLKDRILSSDLATEEELQAIDKKVKQEVEEATEKAQADAEPGVNELLNDTYAKYPHPLRSVATGLATVTHKTTSKPINVD
nr:unnamed protein product [Callosobruchus analis]